MKTISLVVPVFNEEETIPVFYDTIRAESALQAYRVELVFVNDGSQDNTATLLADLAATDEAVQCLTFTRNFGKEAALFAGLEHASGDAVIPIDVDLQDPIELIPQMIARWEAGVDVVLAQRTERTSDSFLKRKTAEYFYKVHNKISHPKIAENVGDFRLMSRAVVNDVIRLPERNLFMKGLLSWVGYEHEILTYHREARTAGKSKFSGWKLWNLALEGLTSFSTAPLKLSTYCGVFIAAFSFVFGLWLIIDKLANGNPVPGYPSLMVCVLFLGGIQLIAIGILGEYIGRIYLETKQRPRYLLKQPMKNEQHNTQ